MFSRSFSFFSLQFFEDFSFLPPLLGMQFQERKTKLKIKIILILFYVNILPYYFNSAGKTGRKFHEVTV